jgi:serine/threonine protein kinase
MDFDPQVLRTGTLIAGYRIERVLGAGGFGITYEVLSEITTRRYALKEFFPHSIASREGATRILYRPGQDKVVAWALERFERSTTELAGLKHPNIVEVFHYLKENNTGYMVMEYVEGCTLKAWLEARTAPPQLADLWPFVEPVVDAIGYMHARNLIHRDVAPDNIMIRPDGRPVLIDFGAMKMIEQRTRLAGGSSYVVSKAGYSSPEQARGAESIDGRTDIYSLGAVLYRAFTGAPPPAAEERTHTLAVGDPDPCVSIGRATLVPLQGKAISTIDGALAIRAADRPGSVDELRTGLVDERAKAAPPAEASPSERRKRPWFSYAAVCKFKTTAPSTTIEEYQSVVGRAVSGLADNTPQARYEIYGRARAALVSSLSGQGVADADVGREQRRLEAAIQKVERASPKPPRFQERASTALLLASLIFPGFWAQDFTSMSVYWVARLTVRLRRGR